MRSGHGHSSNPQIRYADHCNANTYGSYYLNAISTINRQVTYFDVEQQLPILYKFLRGLTIYQDVLFQPEMSWEARTEMAVCAPLIRNVVDKSYAEDK